MIGQMTYANFVDRYRDQSYIGSGGFAKVYKVYDYANNQFVALKIADVRPELKKFTLQNEVALVNQLAVHQNIVKYESCYRFNTGIAGEMDFAVLPFYENGNLEQFLAKNKLNDSEKLKLIQGILKGIKFLHDNNIIHRDLKAENILIHKEGEKLIPKIADFGLSRNVLGHDSAVSNSSIGVSFEYAAPEQIKNKKIYKNVDLWAVGAIIFRIITGTSPFRSKELKDVKKVQSQLEMSRKIIALELPQIYQSISEPYKSIIDKCLVLDAKARVRDAEELLNLLDNSSTSQQSNISSIDDEKTQLTNQPVDNHFSPKPPPTPPNPNDWNTPHPEEDNTELINDNTQLIQPKIDPRPQPKHHFQYSPPKKFEIPTYDNPRKNITQIFAPPVPDEPIAEESQIAPRIKMNDVSDGFNKRFIYIPILICLTVAAAWLLYGWLNPTVTPVPKEEIISKIKASTVPQTFLTCFENNKNTLGGTFKLIPASQFLSTFEAMRPDCYNSICQRLNDINVGKSTAVEFYQLANNGDACLAPLLSTSLAYHHQNIQAQSSMAIFYDSGQSNLSIPQKNELDAFIKKYKKTAGHYGLLIIGRASTSGRANTNRQLSKTRAESIIDFVDNHYIKNLKTAFVYFGADPPQLTKSITNTYGIDRNKYENINFGKGTDPNYSLRLNQSVLLVMYEKRKDPFDLENN